jgi:hypothetical protein
LLLHIWNDGVTCSEDEWSCYGGGAGYDYQMLAKMCPSAAVEITAIGLRNRRQHWGPINRDEVELLPEAAELFDKIQDLIIGAQA